MKKVLLLALIPLAGLGWWAYHRKNQAPRVLFSKAVRETLISTLHTNGKAEPIRWQAVRAERPGLVTRAVQEGQAVSEGAPLAFLRDTGLQADLDAAEARVAQARADLATMEAGGRPLELTTIDGDLARVRAEKEADEREYTSLRQLADKQAATQVEVRAAETKVRAAELAISALEKRRAALVSKADETVARARLRDAEAGLDLARGHIAQTVIHAPLKGTVYDLAARPGVYLNTGDLVANVGQTSRLRVRVYVDEPELGRVREGEPLTITWDALPGRAWEGTVERRPANIVPLLTRQVGEVLATIDNPGGELLPGTHVDAHIRTATVPNALTLSKECLRRDIGGVGVFALRAGHVRWQPVTTGVSSITRVQILSGLTDGDAAALPTEFTMHNGDAVTAEIR